MNAQPYAPHLKRTPPLRMSPPLGTSKSQQTQATQTLDTNYKHVLHYRCIPVPSPNLRSTESAVCRKAPA